jgi:hypothetical protein
MFLSRQRGSARQPIAESCPLCSKPVYDDEPALDFVGLWMHRTCFDAEGGPLTPKETDPRAA